jgi:succinylglutamic semialdehyde dehydrogenase
LWEGPWHTPRTRAYWDEELFAPDLAVYVMGNTDEMVSANNASRFGLVASVFSRKAPRFHELRPLLQNGVVHWNRTTAMTPGRLPFGGLKSSGNFRPAGLFAPYLCVAPVSSVEVPTPA